MSNGEALHLELVRVVQRAAREVDRELGTRTSVACTRPFATIQLTSDRHNVALVYFYGDGVCRCRFEPSTHENARQILTKHLDSWCAINSIQFSSDNLPW